MEQRGRVSEVLSAAQFLSFSVRLCLFQSHFKWAMPLFLLILAASFELVSFQMMFVLGNLYESIAEEDFKSFGYTLTYAGVLIFVTSMIKSIRTYVCDACALDWRKSMVSWLHVHHMQIVSRGKDVGVENIDQRITQDLDELTAGTALLLNDIVIAPFTIAFYSVYLCVKLNWVVPAACALYFVFGAVISTQLSKKLVALTYTQERCEGYFRVAHFSYLLNFEAIRLLRGLVFEQDVFDQVFGKLVKNKYAVIRNKLRVNMFSNWFDLMGAIVNYAAVGSAILYRQGGTLNTGNRSSAEVVSMFATGSYACLSLIHACSTIVDCIQKMAILLGLVHRISELFAQILCTQSPCKVIDGTEVRATGITLIQRRAIGMDMNLSGNSKKHGLLLTLQNMDITISNDGSPRDIRRDKVLIKNISFNLYRGMRVLVTGKSGVGKSSLLKAIAAQTLADEKRAYRSGSASTTIFEFPPSQLMFCPQSPYCFRGSLMANLMYPKLQSQVEAETRDGRNARRVLQSMNMAEFVPYLDIIIPTNTTTYDQLSGLDDSDSDQLNKPISEGVLSEPLLMSVHHSATGTQYMERDWGSVCSLGEQQQICLARLILQEPIVALLDEVTAALDEENEALAYAAVTASCDTFISVGHRSSIRQFHTHELHISKDAGWTFRPIQ